MSEKWKDFGFKSQKSIGDLKDMMSEGEISSQMVAKAFELATGEGGKYNHMLDQMAQTAGGKWAAMTGNFEAFKADVGTALEPLTIAVTDILSNLMSIAHNALPYISETVSNILNFFTGISNGTSEWSGYITIVRNHAEAVWDTIKSLAGNIWHIVSGVIEWVKKSELMMDIFWALGKFGEGIWWVIKKIGDVISWVWDNLIKPQLDRVEAVYKLVKGFLGFGSKTEIAVTNDAGVKAQSGLPKLDATTAQGSKAPGISVTAPTSKADNINSGGQRTITITIGKQIEKLEMHVASAREGVDEIGQMIREELRRVLYSVNGMATN